MRYTKVYFGVDEDSRLHPADEASAEKVRPWNTTPPGSGSGGGSGSGSGRGGSGSGSGELSITSYQGPVTPRGDRTYMYPTDMQSEQAANLAAIKAADAGVTKQKFENALKMYDESDRAIEALANRQVREAERKDADDWQTSQQKLQSSLNAVRNNSGTGWNGSYGMTTMQGYDRADDMADVQLLKASQDAANQAYVEEAEAKQQNANARNELLIDTLASLGMSLDDYVAQMASIYPGFASGVYGPGEEMENEAAEKEGNDDYDKVELFPYRTQSDLDKDLDAEDADLSSITDLAKRNMQAANYDFSPLIDREKREIIAPFWWPEISFDEHFASAVTPRQTEYWRRGDERQRVDAMKKAKTDAGSAASKKSGLAAYINGYNNREM